MEKSSNERNENKRITLVDDFERNHRKLRIIQERKGNGLFATLGEERNARGERP